jgi:hypothetical protein
MSVSYGDGSVSGAAPAGTSTEIYVPPSSTLNLAALSVTFLITFKGWSGASDSTSTKTSFVVDGPAVITSSSEYNYVGIGILALIIALVVIAGTLALARRRRLKDPALRAASSVGDNSSAEDPKHESVPGSS